jgi:hypothetical protein
MALIKCPECGKEISEKQVFCDSCLEVMERFPVNPGTRVLLPNRSAPAVSKKIASRRRVLTAEERLARCRKAIQVLSITLAVAIFALCLSISLLVDNLNSETPNRVIGQNYSTVDADRNAD